MLVMTVPWILPLICFGFQAKQEKPDTVPIPGGPSLKTMCGHTDTNQTTFVCTMDGRKCVAIFDIYGIYLP